MYKYVYEYVLVRTAFVNFRDFVLNLRDFAVCKSQ